MNSSQEARAFISLLDGYYRLTADAHHYLCHEVAPPRVVLSEANMLHGPMQWVFYSNPRIVSHKQVIKTRLYHAVCLQWGLCVTQAEKGGRRGGSLPRPLECPRLSSHHPCCTKQKWGKSTPTLVSGNYCSAARLIIFRFGIYTFFIFFLNRMVQNQATSSFASSRRAQCSAWKAGIKSSPVWRSSQITSKPMCSSPGRTTLLSGNAAYRDKQVCNLDVQKCCSVYHTTDTTSPGRSVTMWFLPRRNIQSAGEEARNWPTQLFWLLAPEPDRASLSPDQRQRD